jgi:(p)ppGpp synthase/HD superfamily hydrolase
MIYSHVLDEKNGLKIFCIFRGMLFKLQHLESIGDVIDVRII